MLRRLTLKLVPLGVVLFIAMSAEGNQPSCDELRQELEPICNEPTCAQIQQQWPDLPETSCWLAAWENYSSAPENYEEDWDWYEEHCVVQAYCDESSVPECDIGGDHESWIDCWWNH